MPIPAALDRITGKIALSGFLVFRFFAIAFAPNPA
jgi:hypothetical protein